MTLEEIKQYRRRIDAAKADVSDAIHYPPRDLDLAKLFELMRDLDREFRLMQTIKEGN